MLAFKENFQALNSPWRWVLGIVAFLLVLFIIIQLSLSIFLDDIAEDYLKENIRKSTDNVYTLRYEDLDLGLLNGSIQFENIRLEPDSSVFAQLKKDQSIPPVWGEATIEAFEIRGISLRAFLFGDKLMVRSVLIERPELFICSIREMQSGGTQKFSSVDSSLYALISKKLTALHLDNFEIRDGSFNLRKQQADEGIASVQKLNLHLKNIHVDSASAQSGRQFITDDIELSARQYAMNLPGGFYTIRIRTFDLSSSDRKISADSLRLIPRLPRYEFSRKKGAATDRTDLSIKHILFQDVAFTRAMQSGRFYAGTLIIDDSRLDIFRSKQIPPPPGRSPGLPQVAFRKLPAPIKIDTIQINDADISYTEHTKGAPKPGTVTFEDTQGTIIALSNYPEELEDGYKVTAKARTSVMGAGMLNLHFAFPMHNPRGFHSIYGDLGSMYITEFNPVLENLAFVHVSEGKINYMKFSMELNKEASHGSMIFNYENLHIELLNSETLDQGTGQEIKSFIANALVIEEANSEPPLRKGEIKFDRVTEKSVFNFWWKSLFSGIKDSIGL